MNSINPPHYKTHISGGKHVSFRLRRGLEIRLTDEYGDANIGMVLYNAENLLERYNAPDTLKCQHTFHLTQGHCLYSDMGRILASVTEDSFEGHESICGNSYHEHVQQRFGERSYQNDRNDWRQNGNDAFLVELAKYGLSKADLPSNINWFNRCAIAEDGAFSLERALCSKGTTVNLRIEMDCVMILHTCPHPLYEANAYPDTRISLSIHDAAPMTEDDLCLNSCDENRRGFENNRIYHLGKS